jgi:hypothetical protein
MRTPLLLALVAVLTTSPGPLGAQARQLSRIARTFELRPRDARDAQFEDGYRRHLDWHLGAGDRSAWYLWEVTNGERAGLLVDGTFDHAWSDFDAAVDPKGDRADNTRNVESFVQRAASQVWRLRPELGPGGAAGEAPDPPETAMLVVRTEYRLRPGTDSAFARALRSLSGAAGTTRYHVYELLSGGELPTYVLWAPATTWAEAGRFMEATARAPGTLTALAGWTRSELWRFRADLSICRSASLRCHRTLPS